MEHCNLCNFPHHDYKLLVRWVNRFGMQERKGRSTMRTRQTERWMKTIENHREERQVWTPKQIFSRKRTKAKEKISPPTFT